MSMPEAPKIRPADFEWLQGHLRAQSGIVIENGRKFLAENRLGPLLWRHGLPGFDALFERMRAQPGSPLALEAVETLCSNETWFFRDMPLFDQLRASIIPSLMSQRASTRELRFWSAGCSNGQEAYSLALLLKHHFPALEGWNVSILGSDLSSAALARAEAAVYTREEVNRGLPIAMLMKYFDQVNGGWRLRPEIAESVRFERIRLDQPWEGLPRFDVILLRNVVSAFAQPDRVALLQRAYDQLAADGALILGAGEQCESVNGFEKVEAGRSWHYRRTPAPAQALGAA